MTDWLKSPSLAFSALFVAASSTPNFACKGALEAGLEEVDGDAAFIAKALGDIARAKGMAQVARDAGLSRESLYKALSGERSPWL